MALRVDPNQLDIVTPITRDLRKKIIQPIGSHAYEMPLIFTVSILLMFDPRAILHPDAVISVVVLAEFEGHFASSI
ncbi:MAG: hypothetical protein WB755_20495 [Terriglobales bacterium]